MTGGTDAAWVEARQREASDPGASVWVTASAGSGKTKVLTDRVLRLLLAGASPERILCLTFTRAAAAEMSNRIAMRLSHWAVMDGVDLGDELSRLLDRPARPGEVERARSLFAVVLDAPGQLNVQTIHAFCGSVLRRFPLEAGLPPQFEVLEERTAGELMRLARDRVIRTADPLMDETLTSLGQHLNEATLYQLLADLLARRGRVGAALAHHGGVDDLERAIHEALGVRHGQTVDDVLRDAARAGPAHPRTLYRVADALGSGSEAQARKAEVLGRWLAAHTEERLRTFDAYRTLFLTAQGEIRKSLLPVAISRPDPGALDAMQEEAHRVLRTTQLCRAARLATHSVELVRVACAILDAYALEKRWRYAVDFHDLVLATLELLSRPGVAPWVLYRLDGGIDHVLVDEAQDTSREQWQIIERLTDEFFTVEEADGGQSDTVRTVFAVGDVKQSIFGFQGAEPERFLEARNGYRDRITGAGARWASVPLDISFRSTAPVLSAVDATFAVESAGDGVRERDPGDALLPLQHRAWRSSQGGSVDWWEATGEQGQETGSREWTLPVSRQVAPRSVVLLAHEIAQRIRDWLDNGEILESRGRPIRPGDIMVLLRSRRPLAPVLTGALKQLGIAVAGVDRMMLSDQMAVKDLVALGQFLLLPADDLTLATVLKGPFAGFSEDELYDLCHARQRRTLWAELNARCVENPAWAAACRLLHSCLERAGNMPPHEFYGALLAEGGRQALLERLGPEAADPVDEFLAQALAYGRSHVPSLQGFLDMIASDDTELKRDLETSAGGEVRIMTVHGSKGLQAPVVFLPDTTRIPHQSPTLYWVPGPGGVEVPVWSPKADCDTDLIAGERARAHRDRDREYRRLLYVAMTRAEDRLVVCGWQPARKIPDDSWHRMVETGMVQAGAKPTELGLRLDAAQAVGPDKPDRPEPDPVALGPLPDHLRRPPPGIRVTRRVTPSRADGTTTSPFGDGDTRRFRRGLLIHDLLQRLPSLPTERRTDAARVFLGRRAPDLDGHDDLVRRVLEVLDAPEHALLFGPASRAEVPVTGTLETATGRATISGRIDRMVVTAHQVLVVDYKSNSRPPRSIEAVPAAYLYQMACYRRLLQDIHPGREVRCALLWTEIPELMDLPADLLDRQ
ncbi:MAG: double-strand break repair helicase AddA [Alphaproteobacteria bacterium]|nr:double-strand break repair helicase AddA [Alphaproteobacteria bacterium]